VVDASAGATPVEQPAPAAPAGNDTAEPEPLVDGGAALPVAPPVPGKVEPVDATAAAAKGSPGSAKPETALGIGAAVDSAALEDGLPLVALSGRKGAASVYDLLVQASLAPLKSRPCHVAG
jgi:hypothetical protein